MPGRRAGRDRGGALAMSAITNHITDGVGGVDDQVEEHLIEFFKMAGDARQIWLKLAADFSHILPRMSRHSERGLNRVIDICQTFLLAAGVGELPSLPARCCRDDVYPQEIAQWRWAPL